MHPIRKQRLLLVTGIVLVASVATGLIVNALQQNLNLFYSPSEVVAGEAPQGRRIRLGGMVVEGSFVRSTDSLQSRFLLTDYQAEVEVLYEGILPDLFSENEGAVVGGRLNTSTQLIADQVLAKHDENYMPPEIAESLKKMPATDAGSGTETGY